MNRTTLMISALMLVLGSPAAAQEEEAKRKFQAASTARDAERDPATAAKLFELLARDEKTPDVLESRAWLEAGRCHARLGAAAEARRCFENAALGVGPAAQEAKDLLAGKPDEAAARHIARVKNAMLQLRRDSSNPRRLLISLTWVRKASAPLFIKEIEAERTDLGVVKGASYIVAAIGGKDFVAFSDRARKDPDRAWRHAVLKGLVGPQEMVKVEETRASVLAWLTDPDAGIRTDAVNGLFPWMSWTQVVAALKDPDARVREAVWLKLYLDWSPGKSGESRGRFDLDAILEHAVDGLVDESASVRGIVSTWMMQTWDRPAGRRLFLRACQLEDRDQLFSSPIAPVYNVLFSFGLSSFEEVVPHADVLAAVKCFPEVPSDPTTKLPLPRLALAAFAASCLEKWDDSAIPTVAALIDRGYDKVKQGQIVGQFGAWLAKRDGDRPVELLAARLPKLGHPTSVLAHFTRRASLPAACFDPIARFVTTTDAGYDVALSLLARTHDPRFPDIAWSVLSRFADKQWGPPGNVIGALTRYRGPGFGPVLAKIAAIDQPWMSQHRNTIAMLLVWHGYADPEAYLTICRLGTTSSQVALDSDWYSTHGPFEAAEMRELPYEEGGRRPKTYWGQGLSWLGNRWGNGATPVRQLDPAEVAKIVEACITIDDEKLRDQAWRELLRAAGLPYRSRSGARHDGRLPKQALAVLFAHAVAAPDPVAAVTPLMGEVEASDGKVDDLQRALFESVAKDEHRGLFRRVFNQRHAPFHRYKTQFERLLKEDRHTRVALRAVLATGDESIVPTLKRLMKHENPSVRQEAFRGIERFDKDSISEFLPVLLREENVIMVRRGIELAKKRLDPAATPALIELLKSESDVIRNLAVDALSAITFYADQKARWERIRKSGGIDAISAAEALIKRAKEGDKETRLVAIESLGTLGVPETLPVLIDWMSDADEDIAKAARAAVARINARK